jgi:hypothetical protein
MTNERPNLPPPDDEHATVFTGPAGEAVTLPAEPEIPAQRPAANTTTVPLESLLTSPEPQQVERLRFGPGVPPVVAAGLVAGQAPPQRTDAKRRRRRWERILNGVLTAALAALVIWLLWPAGALRVQQLSVRAPATVGCDATANVVATVRTNGKKGQLHYRWERNDGARSGELQESVSGGQQSVDLLLRWVFHGPGTYAATATVQLLKPTNEQASVHFDYRCQ